MLLYDLIYADPPWSYNNKATRASADRHYPVMTLQEIKAMEIPAKDNSVLFLWVTAPLLPEGLDVMSAWNFKYITQAIWDKELIALGNYFRSQHEILIFGKRGKFPCPEPANRFPSVIRERRTRHSKKPLKAYEIIEAMYPNANKIELFARNMRSGWQAWGNEIIKGDV